MIECTHLFGPEWKFHSLIIQDHQLQVPVSFLLQKWSEVLNNELPLRIWSPAHGVKGEARNVSIHGLVLGRHAPHGDVVGSVGVQKPETTGSKLEAKMTVTYAWAA